MNDDQYVYDDGDYVYDDDEYAYEAEADDGVRRRRWIVIGAIAAVLVICVCVICITVGVIAYLNLGGSAEPTPTAAPPPVSEGEVQGITWLWTHLFETQPDSQTVVPNPENYLLVFWPNNQFQMKADCNVGTGSYVASGNSATLFPGTITLADCGPDSMANKFLALLSSVGSWTMVDGQLRLNLEDDVGQMVFASGGPATPPSVPPPSATSSPTPPPAQPTPTSEAPQPTPTTNPGAGLVGPLWKWIELFEGEPPSQSVIPDPQNYTLTFFQDATFTFQADCKSGEGTYLEQGENLMLEMGPVQPAECEEGSMADQYIERLGSVVGFDFDGERLRLRLADGQSHMGYVP